MKKVIAGILTLAAVAALCAVMAACSASFAGVYKFSSMSMNEGGVSVNIEAGKEWNGVTFNEDAFILTVNEDYTWTMQSKLFGSQESVKGTWEEGEGKYYLKAEGSGDKMEVTREGNKITFSQDGAKIVLKR